MSLLGTLERDLRALLSEVRKKHQSVNDAAQRALLRVESLRYVEGDLAEEMRRTDDLILPFLLACQAKSTRLVASALSTLQVLVSHEVFPPTSLRPLLRVILPLTEGSDENVHLRVLQTTLSLLTTSRYTLEQKYLSRLLDICFSLMSSKSAIVCSTAVTTLRQANSLIFSHDEVDIQDESKERTLENDIRTESVESLSEQNNKALLYLRDLISLTEGRRPSWLSSVSIPKPLGLELLESLMKQNSDFLAKSETFLGEIRRGVAPLLLNTFISLHTVEFTSLVRTLRCIVVFMEGFASTLPDATSALLARILRMSEKHHPSWQRILAVSSVERLLCDSELTATLFKSFEHSTHLPLEFISGVLYRIVKEHFSRHLVMENSPLSTQGTREDSVGNLVDSEGKVTVLSENFSWKKRATLGLDWLNVDEPPLVYPGELVRLSVRSAIHLIDAIYEKRESVELCEGMVQCTWRNLLRVLSLLLLHTKGSDTENNKQLLGTFRRIILCSALSGGMEEAKDAFLTDLCQVALPQQSDSATLTQVNDKNILVIEELLSFAQNHGSLLRSSWTLLLRVFRHLDRLVALEGRLSPGHSRDDSVSSLRALGRDCELIYERSKDFSVQSLSELIQGLNELCTETLQGSDTKRSVLDESPRIFSARGLFLVLRHNVFRLPEIWNFAENNVVLICTHESSAVQSYGVETLTQLTVAAVTFGATQKDEEESMMKWEGFEFLLLSVFATLYQSDNSIREMCLKGIGFVLQSAGQAITRGFSIILPLLTRSAVDRRVTPGIISSAFESIQLIGNDFIQAQDDAFLEEYLDSLGHFCSQKIDDNVSLSSIALLWNASDFFSQRKSTKDELWIHLFSQIVTLVRDPRPAVRHGALKSGFAALVTHLKKLSLSGVLSVADEMLVSILDGVFAAGEEDMGSFDTSTTVGTDGRAVPLIIHHSRNTVSKQWNETLAMTLPGVLRSLIAVYGACEGCEDDSVKERLRSITNRVFEFVKKGMIHNAEEATGCAIYDFVMSFNDFLPDLIWKEILQLWKGVFQDMRCPPFGLLQKVVATWKYFLDKFSSQISRSDTLLLLEAAGSVVKHCLVFEDISGSTARKDREFSMKEFHVLCDDFFFVLRNFPLFEDTSYWMALFRVFYDSIQSIVSQSNEQMSSDVCLRCMKEWKCCFLEDASLTLRLETGVSVVQMLENLSSCRYHSSGIELHQVAVEFLKGIVFCGWHDVGEGDIDLAIADSLIHALEEILLMYSGHWDSSFEESFLSDVYKNVIPFLSDDGLMRFVDVVVGATRRGEEKEVRLGSTKVLVSLRPFSLRESAWKVLFSLACSDSFKSSLLPKLLDRLLEYLVAFYNECKLVGNFPLDRSVRRELPSVLELVEINKSYLRDVSVTEVLVPALTSLVPSVRNDDDTRDLLLRTITM